MEQEWQTRVELAEHIFAFACSLSAFYFLHGGPEAADTLCDGLALLQSSTYLLVPSLLKIIHTPHILSTTREAQALLVSREGELTSVISWEHGKNLKGQMDAIHFMHLQKTQSATLPFFEDPDQEGNAAHQSPCGQSQT